MSSTPAKSLIEDAFNATLDKLGQICMDKKAQEKHLGVLYNWVSDRGKKMTAWTGIVPIQLNIRIDVGGNWLSMAWCRVDKSTIVGAGYGLFAEKDFKEGDTIGYYWGEKVSTKKRKHASSYQFSDLDAIGGKEHPLRLGMHFLNDPVFGIEDEKKRMEKLKAVNVYIGRDYAVTAKRDIAKGNELFADYNYNGNM